MIGPDRGIKSWREGSHRVIEPAATLARVRPLAAAAGITRLAMLTGLDTTGIAVAAAYRPNSRSVSVHQGKGLSPAAAKASALMEAIETHHAENFDAPLRLASWDEIRRAGEAVDPATLPLARPDAPLRERLLWAEGRDLASSAPVWVPHELVAIDLAPPLPPGGGIFQSTTNGLASGNHPLEAILHGLCEVVERDAVALFQASPPSHQDARAIDPATIDATAPRALLEDLRGRGFLVRVWDASSEMRLPVFACLLAGQNEGEAVQPELGFGCHTDRGIALTRAITEAAQARVTVISGARDDIADEGYRPGALRRQHAAARAWAAAPATRSFRDAPDCAGETLAEDVASVLARLASSGFQQAIHVDLTRAEFGVPVARVIVPGLEGPWLPAGGEYMPGRRARALIAAAA